uniref:SCP domain-containing protein n=1 Tax=Plectus sambesii TaxID=2011161 RepID=A0A914XDE3_9BILA
MCPSTKIDDAGRQTMVNINNAYRSTLIKGDQLDKNKAKNPTGKNMYKLAWDCDLENGAQAWADACSWGHSTSQQRNGTGENLYATTFPWTNSSAMSKAAADSWWSEATTYWTMRSNNILKWANDSSAGHFTQMAWATTYKVGCGMASCPNLIIGWPQATYVVCRYSGPGNYEGSAVYEPGTPCTCATTLPSTCEPSSGLCVINGLGQITTTEAVTTTKKAVTIKETTKKPVTTKKTTKKPVTTKKVGK